MALKDILPGKLGFGAAPLGNMFRDIPEKEALATVNAAWDDGIRYFDQAWTGGYCTKTGCDVEGRECAGTAVCATPRTSPSGGVRSRMRRTRLNTMPPRNAAGSAAMSPTSSV